MQSPVGAPDASPKRLSKKLRLDTSAVDGMRGFAVFHIVVGHLFLYSDTRFLNPFGSSVPAEGSGWPADSPCPTGWGRIGNSCYFIACEKQPWTKAQDRCSQLAAGAGLLSVDTLGDLETVTSKTLSGDGADPNTWSWTGLNERDQKGTWVWSDGRPVNQTAARWAPGEPNDYDGASEECAAVLPGGYLVDAPCQTQVSYSCRVAAKLSNCPALGCPDEEESWKGVEVCAHGPCQGGTVALMGGGSMGFFYIISGFVMVIGYCQVMLRPARECRETVCSVTTDTVCCCCCNVPSDEPGQDTMPVLSAWEFLLKRFARLAPMYFLTNTIGLVMRTVVWEAPLNVPSFIGSFVGMTSWYLAFPVGNELTWTISTMWFFYMCFPALAPRMQRISPRSLRCLAFCMYGVQMGLMVVGNVGLLFVVQDGYWIRMFPPVRLPIFIMGMCCGFARVHVEQAREAAEAAALEPGTPVARVDLPRVAGEVECCCPTEPCLPASAYTLLWLLTSLICTVGVYFCNAAFMIRSVLELVYPALFYDWVYAVTDPMQKDSFTVRFFKSRPMRFLGDISLCAYMLHMVLHEALAYALGVEVRPFWTIFAVLPVTIILGWVFTQFFEKPVANCIRPDKRKVQKEDSHCTPTGEKDSMSPQVVVVGAAVAVADDKKVEGNVPADANA